MLDRRALFASFAVVAMALPALADSKAFKSADFDKAKTSGKPVLVEVTAPLVSNVQSQKPILSELKAQPGSRTWPSSKSTSTARRTRCAC